MTSGTHPKSILLVEDEFPLRAALSEKFSSIGLQVLEAENGEIGLQQALFTHPNIILLDIIMPKMDGIAMLKQLRSDSWGKDVTVIIMTNIDDNEHVAEALSYGVYEFLVKADWQINKLVSKIRKELNLFE